MVLFIITYCFVSYAAAAAVVVVVVVATTTTTTTIVVVVVSDLCLLRSVSWSTFSFFAAALSSLSVNVLRPPPSSLIPSEIPQLLDLSGADGARRQKERRGVESPRLHFFVLPATNRKEEDKRLHNI